MKGFGVKKRERKWWAKMGKLGLPIGFVIFLSRTARDIVVIFVQQGLLTWRR